MSQVQKRQPVGSRGNPSDIICRLKTFEHINIYIYTYINTYTVYTHKKTTLIQQGCKNTEDKSNKQKEIDGWSDR